MSAAESIFWVVMACLVSGWACFWLGAFTERQRARHYPPKHRSVICRFPMEIRDRERRPQ